MGTLDGSQLYPINGDHVNGAKFQDDQEAIFLVNVGGREGHDLVELYRKLSQSTWEVST